MATGVHPPLVRRSAHGTRRSSIRSIDRAPHLACDQAVEFLVAERFTLSLLPSLAGDRFGDGERDLAKLRHRRQQRRPRIPRGGGDVGQDLGRGHKHAVGHAAGSCCQNAEANAWKDTGIIRLVDSE